MIKNAQQKKIAKEYMQYDSLCCMFKNKMFL